VNLSYRNEKNAKFIAEMYKKPLDQPDWYKIENVSEDEAEVFISSYIGWPFNDPDEFVKALSGMKHGKIVIRINSPGGDVFAAHQIFNAIRNHPSKPTTRIESLAASAASYIAVAGHEKQAYKNTMIMIHEPMTGFVGNQYEMREVANLLEKISGTMVDMYADNTNVGKRELKAMLKAETWLTAKQAKEKGFIDTIIEAGSSAKAAFDLSMFANYPGESHAQAKTGEPTIRNIEALLRDAGGLSKDKAKALLARGWQAIGNTDNDSGDVESAETLLKKITGK